VTALAALCVTVTVSYGVLYYAFTVLAPSISTDTGWSATAVTAAFSIGSLTGAVAGIGAGRLLHRRGPRAVMSVGSLLGALALAVVCLAPTYPVFVAGWLLVGTASSGTFYPPAFAALTGWFGTRRVRAITTLTLVAGFASTIFAPLTATLGEHLGWRGTYAVLAGVLLLTLPAHLWALRLPWPAATSSSSSTSSSSTSTSSSSSTSTSRSSSASTPPSRTAVSSPRPDREVYRSRMFLFLVSAATLTSLAMYASLVNLVPLLLDRGMDVHLAAWALGLGGAGQVAGRLLYPLLDHHLGTNTRAAAVMAAVAITVLALGTLPGAPLILIGASVIAGAARGLETLVGATLVADHWGPERYAVLNGVFAAPSGIAAALAPAFGAAVAALAGGYQHLFVVLAAIALIAAALAATASPRARQ
jgi:MFS family permease